MESKENEDINPINDDAPPVLYESLKNNNSIYINESNYSLFPNNINNNLINQEKQININKMKNPFNYQNPFLLKNQMGQQYNLMFMNYFNQMQKNNIKNIHMPSNNINNIKFEKNDNNYCDLNLNISVDILKILDKQLLIDIILYIHDICKIKLEQKFVRFYHKIFKIYKKPGKNNEYLFSIKKRKEKLFFYQLNQNNNQNINNNIKEMKDDNNTDSSSDENNEKDIIINEENMIHDKNKINNESIMCNTIYCDLHKKIYLKSDYENHLKTHKKCEICGNEFKTKKELRFHINMTHLDDKKSSNNNLELFKQNLNKHIDTDKIKCIEYERTFGSAEAMSAHYYDMHEKKE